MGAQSTINVTEEETGRFTQFNNDDCGANINYKIYRDFKTGEFPRLKISYTYEVGYTDCIYGCIAVPEYDIEYVCELSMYEELDCWFLEWGFDFNKDEIPEEEEEIPKKEDVNEVFVKIYTAYEA